MPQPLSSTVSAADSGTGHLHRLVWLRGLAIVGLSIMLACAGPLFRIVVPLTVPLDLLLLSAALNFVTWMRLKHPKPVGNRELLLQLGADLVLLTAFLAFTGGPANPLTSLYLPTVAVGAAILPTRYAWMVAILSVAAYSLLWQFSVPLTVEDVDGAMQMHLTGMWLTFAVSALLIAGFVTRMTGSLREHEQQLASAREKMLRDERIVALGNLAAGAAHELGTPLATMAILAGEIADDLSTPVAQQEDLKLLREQIAACKRIITGLAAGAGAPRAEDGGGIRADRWIESILAHWRTLRPQATPLLTLTGSIDQFPPPHIVREQTLEHAVLSLLNNAADASPDDVGIVVGWTQDHLQLEILDRGSGIEAANLERAGRDVFSTRSEGAGIGLLLAHAAIRRLGGNIAIKARPGGGTFVQVELPLNGLSVGSS